VGKFIREDFATLLAGYTVVPAVRGSLRGGFHCHPSHSVFNVGMGTTLKCEKPERWLGNFSPILLNCVLLLWKFMEAVEAVEDTTIFLKDIRDGQR